MRLGKGVARVKAFRFSLESALRWRKAQSTQEEETLKHLIADQQRLEAELRSIEAARRTAAREHLSSPSLLGFEVRHMAAYSAGLAAQSTRLRMTLVQAAEMVRRQQSRCLEAERRVELLAGLKTKHHDVWRREADLELDLLAAESYLSRRVRENS
jgi:hypothetical protein